MKLFFLFLAPLFLFATIIEPYTLDFSTGYREDTLRFRLFNPGDDSTRIYQDKYKGLRFLQTELTVRKVQRDIYLWANGGFSCIGSGDFSQSSLHILDISNPPSYTFGSRGWAAHAMGLFGYCVNLTPGRYYRVAFTPCAGYEGYWQKMKPKDPSPNPATVTTIGGESEISSSQDPDTYFRWNGFIVGGNIQILPGNGALFDLFYGYNFLQFRKDFSFAFTTSCFDAMGNLTLEESMAFRGKAKTHDALGHLGMVRAAYPFSTHLEGAIFGRIFYFSTHIQDTDLHEVDTAFFPVPSISSTSDKKKYKFTQLSISALLQLSYKI